MSVNVCDWSLFSDDVTDLALSDSKQTKVQFSSHTLAFYTSARERKATCDQRTISDPAANCSWLLIVVRCMLVLISCIININFLCSIICSGEGVSFGSRSKRNDSSQRARKEADVCD